MTLEFLLDTSVVSAPMHATPDPELMRNLERHAGESAIASVVWHELVFGCRRLPHGRRRTALETYLDEVVRTAFPILPYDEHAAAWHGLERARLESLGHPSHDVDAQIAAVAHANGLALVTVNIKDFSRFKGLDVLDWTKRRRRP